MIQYARLLAILSCVVASASLSACEEEPPACPAGPVAPLGDGCTDEGQTCQYGYDVPGCGGRTVLCSGGTWIEKEHTDPSQSCHPDAGATCSYDGKTYAEGDVVRKSTAVSCICLASGELGRCTGAVP